MEIFSSKLMIEILVATNTKYSKITVTQDLVESFYSKNWEWLESLPGEVSEKI